MRLFGVSGGSSLSSSSSADSFGADLAGEADGLSASSSSLCSAPIGFFGRVASAPLSDAVLRNESEEKASERENDNERRKANERGGRKENDNENKKDKTKMKIKTKTKTKTKDKTKTRR